MIIKLRVITKYNRLIENAPINLEVDSFDLWNLLSVLSLSPPISHFFVDNGSGFTVNKNDEAAIDSYDRSFRNCYGPVYPSSFEKWIYLH